MSEPFIASRGTWGWERWAPLAGVAAVVLWVIGAVVGGSQPDAFEATGQEWLTEVTDDEGPVIASRVLFLLGTFAFIVFLGSLRTHLLAGEGEPRHWTAMAFGSGIAAAVLFTATATPLLAAAAVSEVLSPAAAQALAVSEIAFFFATEIALAALFAATGLLAIRTAVLPAWLGWASLVLAVLVLVVATPIGFVATLAGLPLWVLVTSVLVWRRGGRAGMARETRGAAPLP